MSFSICAGPACKCVKLVTKINLFKPVSIEEVSSFMNEPSTRCDRSASDYWSMRTVQINWGTSSELVTVHVIALNNVTQHVYSYVPF